MESTLVEMLRQRECEPDVWTMNSTLRAFGSSGQIETMEKCYEKFQCAGIQPSIKTFNILLGVFCDLLKIPMWHLTLFFNCLVDAYGMMECFAEMKGVLEMMERKMCKPDKITYRTMIKPYSHNNMTRRVKELRDVLASLERTSSHLKEPFSWYLTGEMTMSQSSCKLPSIFFPVI